MKKKLLTLALTAMMAATFTGCSSSNSGDSAKGDGNEAYKISVIVKATDSDYWQTLFLGAKAAEKELGGKVVVTTDGPTSEIDVDKQLSILENAIATKPNGIVITSTSADATVPAIEGAVDSGIPVITIDNKINSDKYTSYLATDHAYAAGQAAEAMVKDWEEAGINPSGKKVVVVSSLAGSKVNTDRTNGFIDKIKELVPDIQVLETQYGDNDISKALGIAENLISANKDLIGIFADNNHMGVGVAKAIEESKREDVICYAFDADEDEIAALENGYIKGLVVQNPFGMGYDGVFAALAAIEGKEVEKDVVVDATIVTKKNMKDPEVHKLLYPGE